MFGISITAVAFGAAVEDATHLASDIVVLLLLVVAVWVDVGNWRSADKHPSRWATVAQVLIVFQLLIFVITGMENDIFQEMGSIVAVIVIVYFITGMNGRLQPRSAR